MRDLFAVVVVGCCDGESSGRIGGGGVGRLREVAASFVAPGPTGVAIRAGLKGLTGQDEKVMRLVGDLLGPLASRDGKPRCAAGLDHDRDQWAQRKRALTGQTSCHAGRAVSP